MHKYFNNLGKTHRAKFRTGSNVIFTCEHASPRIPKSLKRLGLTKKELKNCKDLYDPGAKELFDLFVKKYRGSHIYSNLSRLVIDANRHLDSKIKNSNTYHSALVKKQILVEDLGQEFFVDIPHNNMLRIEDEKYLYEKVCLPYQNDIKKMIQKMMLRHDKVFIISIHTMFPKYNGPIRTQGVDLMGNSESDRFLKVTQEFRNFKELNIGINSPWSFADSDYGVFFEIIKIKNVHVMAIEVRNDLVRTKKDVKKIFDLINEKVMEFTK